MWGTFLSEPLDIVAMVGRYPAIQLMSREPIRFRNSLIIKRCLFTIPWGISRRFQRLFPRNGQVAHALRTLAPVAINTSTNLRVMLPLDLHVLSLPLAFILSQDQTLHCIILYNS